MTHAFGVITKRGVYSVLITPPPPSILSSSPLPPALQSFFYARVANYEMLYSTLLLLSPAFKL